MSILELENALKVGSSTISKAIKRNSVIKPEMMDKLSKTFPDVDFKKLEIELLGADPVEIPDAKTPTSNEAGGDIQGKYIALLERLEGRYQDLADTVVAKAITRLEQTFATRQDVMSVSSSLEKLREVVEKSAKEMEALSLFFSGRIAALEKVPVEVVDEALDIALLAAHEPQNTRKKAAVDR